MSDHISFDIQTEIIKRLDVKSLIRFRSVSKTWKSLIESPKFVASYGIINRRQKHPRLLVRYSTLSNFSSPSYAFVSFVDDDDDDDDDDKFLFGQTIVPLLPKEFYIYRILGSSHGLFCLCCIHRINDTTDTLMYVIWNPSIRKTVFIEDPQTRMDRERRIVFGVCPVTRDPKLVRVIIVDLKWLVDVYTLSSDNWRNISNNNLPRGTICVNNHDDVVVTDKFIYWDATDEQHNDKRRLVVSFDLTNEEFMLIDIPDFIAHDKYKISKLKDSLVLLTYLELETDKVVSCDVWMMMMNDGNVSKTFTKLYNIKLPHTYPVPRVKGFTKSGTHIIITMGMYNGMLGGLYVFERNSKRFTEIELEKLGSGFNVYNYHETLLLLDRLK